MCRFYIYFIQCQVHYMKFLLLKKYKILPIYFFVTIYDEGSGARQRRMLPSEATSYLTTRGKSFSK